MWTYKRPYHSEELTKEYIEERGTVALSRALSIGRVIGFVASGATVGYGQPDWNALVKEAKRLADDAVGNGSKRMNGAARTAQNRLKQLEIDETLTDDHMHSLGLAERLAAEVGQSEQFRDGLGAFFASNRTIRTQESKPERVKSVGVNRKSEPLRRLISDLRINRLLTLNYDTEIEEEFRRMFRTSGAPSNETVALAASPASDFERLCSSEFETARGLPARVEYSDGTTRSVLSVSMNASNIGELVNFAVQPLQFVGQVFHLHGRFDQPQDMVLTDADYRSTYLKSDEQAQTFDEALSALMSGNDILFVGVGMSEADLLRPLRQFVSQDKSPEFSKRHVFAMREHTVSLDSEWLHQAASPAEFESAKSGFYDLQIRQWDRSKDRHKGSACKDYSADEKTAVMFRSEYGVYSIFHGGQALRSILLAQKLITACAKGQAPEGPLVRKIDPLRYLASLEAMHVEITRLGGMCTDPPLTTVGAQILTKPEFDILATTLKRIINALWAEWKIGKKRQMQNFVLEHLEGFESEKERKESVSPRIDQSTLKKLASEARSRALDLAIANFADKKDQWWGEWRTAPKSRDAEFRRLYTPADAETEQRPSVARHRPIYDSIDLNRGAPPVFEVVSSLSNEANQCNQQIEELIKESFQSPGEKFAGGHLEGFDTNTTAYFNAHGGGAQRNFQTVPPKRVVRVAVPRGHGKGSLLHILQQPVPITKGRSKRLYLDTLFDGAAISCLSDCRYFGTFFLHLSFSMEFASVISALRIFVEQATCGLFLEYPKLVLERAEQRLEEGKPGTFLQVLHDQLLSPQNTELKLLLQQCQGIEGVHKREKIKELRKLLSKLHWDRQTLGRGPMRMHRLEQLRSRLSAYTDVIDLLKDRNLRLGIVMSGLDKLCDSNGTAHNPMFRALFRLLTGCGAKYPSESDITAPIDLFLISGSKDCPPRYLSEEFSKSQLAKKLERPNTHGEQDTYASYTKFRAIADNRHLAVWPMLQPMKFSDRYWLKSEESRDLEKLLSQSKEEILATAKLELSEGDYMIESSALQNGLRNRELYEMCKTGVALHSWVAGMFGLEQRRLKIEDANAETRKRAAVDFVNHMNAAAERGEIPQVLREVLECHKRELRKWGAALLGNLRDSDIANYRDWPNTGIRKIDAQNANIADDLANQLVDLVYLILSHLSLFPMPVEARVLYGCDEIYTLLKKICDPYQFEHRPPPDEHPPFWRDTSRLVRLRLLSQVLDYLRCSSLIIAVRGKAKSLTNAPFKTGDIDRTDDDIHTRYTVQHQLRDFSARLMDLSLPDQGEQNFFQVSVYCEQPRDLPAPREEHYELVRKIMDRQIDQSRNTVWTLMQMGMSNEVREKKLSTEEKDLFAHGLKRRLMKLSDGNDEIDAQLPSIHAVPQRIRALYGLLRSGFSIGTISRLNSLDGREIDQPYERFRGWLRGVTNAAIGWDYVTDRLFTGEWDYEPADPKTNAIQNIGRIADAIADGSSEGTKPKTTSFEGTFQGFAKPLYRDEIGWLLNERGLVSLVQGQIFDAIPLFQRALDEMHHDDLSGNYDPSLHAAVRRVRLNLAIALIDRGHLGRAMAILKDLKLAEDFSSHSGSQVSWLSEGYIGLIHHLSGNLERAIVSYDQTIGMGREKEMMRVVGIFSKHKADLLRRQGLYNNARETIVAATNAALNCAQRDILHLAKISEGNLDLVDPAGSRSNAGICMIEALHFAQAMGIPRLESEARCLQASMMLAESDRMLAGSFAAEAAAIANRNGLRLNKLRALMHYGAALRHRGQTGLAIQVLTETRRESERRGYQGLAKGLAEELRNIQ